MLDVVIPCLNAACDLAVTLPTLGVASPVSRVIVCDGGSVDDSVDVARRHGAHVVAGSPGRGTQLAAGAAATVAPWVLFLHADTRLGAGWQAAALGFMGEPANLRRAGYFRLRFASEHRAARRVERLARWRAVALGLPYGDQGLLIARRFYDALGGFRPMPLMEDVELVRRIGRRNLVALEADATTSAARYERDGWILRPVRNLLCLTLYAVGVPPGQIKRLYG